MILSQILKELKESIEPVNGSELAGKLKIDRTALDSMLEELVKLGKLRKVRQLKLDDCQQELKAGQFSLYGDVCAFIGSTETVIHYEITSDNED